MRGYKMILRTNYKKLNINIKKNLIYIYKISFQLLF